MNTNLPYEEKIKEQLADIPLPDEDMAWEDMRRRLEEDDDDRIVPLWLRGCGLWGLIGLIILALSWWIIRPETWWTKKDQAENTSIEQRKRNDFDNKSYQKNTTQSIHKKDELENDDLINNKEYPADTIQVNSAYQDQNNSPKTNISLQITSNHTKKKSPGPVTTNQQNPENAVSNYKPGKEKSQLTETGKPVITSSAGTNDDTIKNNLTGVNKSTYDVIKDSVPVKNDSLITVDSTSAIEADSLSKAEITELNKTKKDSTRPDKIFFSAGTGLQQQIPINGQKLSPYSSLGRKNLLTDYIPPVYFQANKPGKWFANIGFRYGAPQYNKEFTYNQNIVLDSGQNVSTTTTSLTLKKSFYHQLPVTFNYYIRPGWSAGAGVVWNKFYGAVADREVIKQNGQQMDTLSKSIVSFKSDTTSSFSKSYFQALIELEYNWKRFYFGIRYSFGLQPYIQFSLPGGTQQKEKNSSLQLYIRYDLWRSKKK